MGIAVWYDWMIMLVIVWSLMSFIARGLNVMINIGKGVVTGLDNYIGGIVGFQVALIISILASVFFDIGQMLGFGYFP